MFFHHIWRFWSRFVLPCDVQKSLYWGYIKFPCNSKCLFNIRFYVVFCHHCRPHQNRKIVWYSVGMSEEVAQMSAIVNPWCRSQILRTISQYTDADLFIYLLLCLCLEAMFLTEDQDWTSCNWCQTCTQHIQNCCSMYLSYPSAPHQTNNLKTTARNTTGSNHCIILVSSWWWA